MRVSGRLIMILLRLSHGYLQLPSGSQMWLGNPRSNGGFTGEIHENHLKLLAFSIANVFFPPLGIATSAKGLGCWPPLSRTCHCRHQYPWCGPPPPQGLRTCARDLRYPSRSPVTELQWEMMIPHLLWLSPINPMGKYISKYLQLLQSSTRSQ